MDFGLHLGTRGAAAHPDNLARIAQHADGLGLSYLGFSDHVVIARQIDSKYPYNETGDWPGVATVPSIVMRPSPIQPSTSRREPMPRADRTFWMRSFMNRLRP